MLATDRILLPVRLWVAGLVGLALAGVAWAQGPSQPPLVPPPAASAAVMVADVKVEGNRNTPAERVLGTIRTRTGRPYNQSTVDEDVRLIMATGLFARVDVSKVERPENRNLVDVYFRVLERPQRIQEIVYNGGVHIKIDELKKITHLHRGDPMVPYLNDQACKSIVAELYKQGRPFATCELAKDCGGSPSDTRVVFNITEGPKIKVKDVAFEGNTFVSGARLYEQVKSSHEYFGLFGGNLNLIMVEFDVEELEKYYKSFGYHDVHVSREIRWEPDGQHVILVFHINEGARYRVSARPQVDGAGREMPLEVIQAIPRLNSGEFYDEKKVQEDIRAIQDYYGMTGRDVKVKPEPFFNADTPGVCQVHYQVLERPPSKVGYVYIVGNDVTRQNVILRNLPEGLSPGQTLQYPDLRLGERNLAKLGIFETSGETGVRPTIEVLNREGDDEYKDLLVRVQETKTGQLMFGVGVNSDAGLTGSVVLNERNFDITRWPDSFDDLLAGRAFRGADEEFRIQAMPGTQVQQYSATWRNPMIFDSPFSFEASVYYWDRIYNEYTESRLGTRYTLGRQLNKYWTAYGSVRVEDVGVHDVPYYDPEDYQSVIGDNFLAGFKVGVKRDTRDSYLRATEGNLLDVSFEEVTGDFTFPVVNVDFSQYWTVYERPDKSGRQVLAYHGQFAWEGSNAPVYERFFAGGFRSMRGFEFRGISPQVDGVAVGGDFMVLNSLEYQIPLRASDNIYFVTFVDTGTVESRVDLKDYRVAAGFGVRFVVPMLGPVPIALDFGFPIVKATGDHEQVFSFWLGFFH